MVDLIWMGYLKLQGAKTENYEMKNTYKQRQSNLRPLYHKSSAVTIRPSDMIYNRKFKT